VKNLSGVIQFFAKLLNNFVKVFIRIWAVYAGVGFYGPIYDEGWIGMDDNFQFQTQK